MSMSPGAGTGVLIFADRMDPAGWARGQALARSERRAGRNALLRDGGELETALSLMAGASPDRSEGVRHLLRIQYQTLCLHFALDRLALLFRFGDAAARFLASLDFLAPFAGTEPEAAAEANPSTGVLIATNDIATCASKTSEWLAQACEELGLSAFVEDTGPLRALALLAGETDSQGNPDNQRPGREEVRDAVRAHFAERVGAAGAHAGTVLALDLNWFLDPAILLGQPEIGRIVSFWFDDVKSWCQAPYNNCLPGAIARLQEALRDPKVVHCCYGRAQQEEMRVLGLANTRLSFLAAPTAYLRRRAGPEITARAAFLGNPGLNVTPRPALLEMLERGADLPEIRAHARDMGLAFGRQHFAALIAREPSITKWLALALEAKMQQPHAAAAALLRTAATHHPAALDAVNASGEILNALTVVKMVNQFDRPALVYRLHRAGLLDVYSRPEEWAPYGIAAQPDICFPDLPAVYQRYTCHLNGYNAARDATANEKLFEIAACGRVSVNLDTPDVRECYEEGEVAFAATLEGAEARVREFLADPGLALEFGARARRRTARDHLWSHRLRALFQNPTAAAP